MAVPGTVKTKFRVSACLVYLVIGLVGLYLVLRGLGAFLIVGDRLKKSDGVVVLGGGEEDRVVEAVLLIREQYGAWLILTEPGEVEPGKGPASEVYTMVAVDSGLSPHAILVTDEEANSTYDEAVTVRHLMEKQNFKSVIVVTDPYHTLRTRLIFREVFKGSGLTVRVHPVVGHWYRSDTWFLSLDGWANTIREYVKLVGYLSGLSKLD